MATPLKRGGPPRKESPPVTQEDYARATYKIAVRTETRLTRMMKHLGLNAHGEPLPVEPVDR